MIPESIQNNITDSLDATWLQRLEELDLSQLQLRFEEETDNLKLDYITEQMGVPLGLFDFGSMTKIQRRDFLRRITKINQLSGTTWSMSELALALGATKATVELQQYQLKYNAKARYNSYHKYDKGSQYIRYQVSIEAKGVATSDQTIFEERYRKAFKAYEPARVYLDRVAFL